MTIKQRPISFSRSLGRSSTITEPNIWCAFQEAGFEFDTSIALHLMRKSAETRADFKKYGRVTSALKTCRPDCKMPGLVRLIAKSKIQ
jgi:hypothetical protein